jgi:hypothetical protein
MCTETTEGLSKKGVRVARVVFLGGLGRSGTTLLERMLGEVPGVCALGEVVHLWQRDVAGNEACGCGTPFRDCPFWTEVGARAFGGWHNVDVDEVAALRARVERTRHIPALALTRTARARAADIRAYAGYYTALYQAAAEVSGASVVIDSSKHSALAFCLRAASLPVPGTSTVDVGEFDLRVVHLVRDSRGVAYSWTKHVRRPEVEPVAGAPIHRPETAPEPSDAASAPGRTLALPRPRVGEPEEMTRYAPARSALLWTAHNAAFELLARSGVPVRRLRYESLIADPRTVLASVAAFAGIDVSMSDLAFLTDDSVTLGPCHSAAGNPMRFLTGRIPLRRDDAWVAALPPRQRRLVGALTAPMLGAYGYRLTGRQT